MLNLWHHCESSSIAINLLFVLVSSAQVPIYVHIATMAPDTINNVCSENISVAISKLNKREEKRNTYEKNFCASRYPRDKGAQV